MAIERSFKIEVESSGGAEAWDPLLDCYVRIMTSGEGPNEFLIGPGGDGQFHPIEMSFAVQNWVLAILQRNLVNIPG